MDRQLFSPFNKQQNSDLKTFWKDKSPSCSTLNFAENFPLKLTNSINQPAGFLLLLFFFSASLASAHLKSAVNKLKKNILLRLTDVCSSRGQQRRLRSYRLQRSILVELNLSLTGGKSLYHRATDSLNVVAKERSKCQTELTLRVDERAQQQWNVLRCDRVEEKTG